MDTRTGKILSAELMAEVCAAGLSPEERKFFEEMEVSPTPKQMARHPPRVGKYDPCPCGSGRKFKWCCYTGPAMLSQRKVIERSGR